MMRPSVSSPTGTLMPSPVFSATRPRLRPSVEPSAIVRTMPSPSCCCTSNVISVFSHLQRVVHLRHGLARELDVDDGADDLYDFALAHFRFLETQFFSGQLRGEAELLSNQSTQRIFDLAVSWYRCLPSIGRVQIQIVSRTVSQQHAALGCKLADLGSAVRLISSRTGLAFADGGGGSIGPLDITV